MKKFGWTFWAISFITISLLKNEFSTSPWSSVRASLALSASISDFSVSSKMAFASFSPSCCFMAGEVGKDQLFQIGHSNCAVNQPHFSPLQWLAAEPTGFTGWAFVNLSGLIFNVLHSVHSELFGFISFWKPSIFPSSRLWIILLCLSSALSSLQCSAPFLLVLGVRTLRYLPHVAPNTVQAVTGHFSSPRGFVQGKAQNSIWPFEILTLVMGSHCRGSQSSWDTLGGKEGLGEERPGASPRGF